MFFSVARRFETRTSAGAGSVVREGADVGRDLSSAVPSHTDHRLGGGCVRGDAGDDRDQRGDDVAAHWPSSPPTALRASPMSMYRQQTVLPRHRSQTCLRCTEPHSTPGTPNAVSAWAIRKT